MWLSGLMNNPYAWLILSFCTIAAFGFAIYTWIKGKRKKEFSYISNSYKIIEKGKSCIPKLQLIYGNRNVDNLTITKFAIWNSGNDAICFSDIVNEKPLTILSKEEETDILDAQIIAESDQTNKFEIVEVKDGLAKLNFDYSNSKDGIVVQIIHTGKSENLEVDCKIKGGRPLKNLGKRKINKNVSRKKRRNIMAILMSITIIELLISVVYTFLVTWGIIDKDIFVFSENANQIIISRILSIIMVMAMFFAMYMFFNEIKTQYHINIPTILRESIEYDNYDS